MDRETCHYVYCCYMGEKRGQTRRGTQGRRPFSAQRGDQHEQPVWGRKRSTVMSHLVLLRSSRRSLLPSVHRWILRDGATTVLSLAHRRTYLLPLMLLLRFALLLLLQLVLGGWCQIALGRRRCCCCCLGWIVETKCSRAVHSISQQSPQQLVLPLWPLRLLSPASCRCKNSQCWRT